MKTLKDFLYRETNARELCVIREGGWVVATCWIDYEDLFAIPQRLADKIVKREEWGCIEIVNKDSACIKIPCHYVDV